MLKKLFANQSGVSLIEAVVAMGLTVAAGVAYMTHMQTVAKNEMQTKIKSALTLIENQANDHLKSRDVCNDNMFKAFNGKLLNTPMVDGNPTHKRIINKGYVDAAGNMVQKDIILVDTSFEGGSIWVSDVSYRLENVQEVIMPSSPWNKSATLKINVTFERCASGGPVYRQEPGQAKVLVCAKVIKQSKIFEKLSAFKTDAAGVIALKPAKYFDIPTQKWLKHPTDKVPQAACADSQDALVDAAKEYADMKYCAAELKMMMLAGKSGPLGCGLVLNTTDKNQVYNNSGTLPLPTTYVPNSLVAEILGGGGGGGNGGRTSPVNRKRGGGGKAGQYQMVPLNNLMVPSCAIQVGNAGGSNADGGLTRLTCGSSIITAAGGANGDDKIDESNCGQQGQNSVDLNGAVIGVGSTGNCRTSTNPSVAGPGAGGAGGAEANHQSGKPGGKGWAKVKWKEYSIDDPEGVLEIVGTSIAAMIAGN